MCLSERRTVGQGVLNELVTTLNRKKVVKKEKMSTVLNNTEVITGFIMINLKGQPHLHGSQNTHVTADLLNSVCFL